MIRSINRCVRLFGIFILLQSPTPSLFSQTCPTYGGCTYQPLNYYTFDDPGNLGVDCIAGGGAYAGSGTSIGNTANALCGKYAKMNYNPTGALVSTFGNHFFPNTYSGDPNSIVNSKSFTYELAFRINSDYAGYIYLTLRGSFRLSLDPAGIEYLFWFQPSSGGLNSQYLRQNYSGTGVLSSNYLLDHQWHHLAIVFDGNTGNTGIWIDGQTHTELNASFTPGSAPYFPSSSIGGGVAKPSIWLYEGMQDNSSFDVDEVAFFDSALPGNLIIQHYNDVTNGQHYSCTANPSIVVPPLVSGITGNYDPLDFAPNHPFNAPVASGGQPITTDNLSVFGVPPVLDQLMTYPLPRFKKGHLLNKNMNWMSNEYLSSNKFVNGPYTQNWQRDIDIQTELCDHWNYMFNLNSGAYYAPNQPLYQAALNNFANTNGNKYRYSIITNINSAPIYPITDSVPDCLTPDTLACPGYNTAYINAHGCLWGPNQKTKNYFEDLGNSGAQLIINNVINAPTVLTHPIDYISENGYESCLFDTTAGTLCVYNLKLQPGSTQPIWPFPTGSITKWSQYVGDARYELETSYRDAILGCHPMIPATARYSKYLVTGINPGISQGFCESYENTRGINTSLVSPYSNNVNHHSTPATYVSGPANWISGGPNSLGLGLMQENYSYGAVNPNCRTRELAFHDSLFAPFIAGGWNQEKDNVRPAQYLGIAKALGVMGADYYQVGYFNETNSGVFPTGTTFPVDPRGFCYQAAMPVYAQAITSRFEKILHCSSINYHKLRNQTYFISRNLVGPNSSRYLLYGTIQQMYNFVGNSPVSTIYQLDDVNSGVLNGLKFEIRRQGSTYIYESSSNLFYQLDKWHESTHPSYWSGDFEIEAELNDYTGTNTPAGVNDYINNTMALKTDVPPGTPMKDFTDYTTYIGYPNGAPTKSYYYFEPRDIVNPNMAKTYYVWVKARAIPTAVGGLSKLDLKVNDVQTATSIIDVTIPCIDNLGGAFKWYVSWVPQGQIGVPVNGTANHNPNLPLSFAANPQYEYEIIFEGNNSVEFDKFILTENPGIPAGVNPLDIAQVNCPLSNRPSGVLENAASQKSELQLQPNPSTGRIEVFVKDNDDEVLRKIRILNVQGKEVYLKEYSGTTRGAEINLDVLTGIYFAEITTNYSTTTKKLIIAK